MTKFTLKTIVLFILFITTNINFYAQNNILSEDFSSIISGDNTTTGGSGTAWLGNTNFPTVVKAYQAGGVVKLGTSSLIGSITSLPLDLSVNGGSFKVKFKVKGWTTVEGTINVTVTGLTQQIVTYTSVMAGSFEQIDLSFTGGTANSTVKIETSAKRAYIDDVIVYYESAATPTITTPSPTSINTFASLLGNASPSQTFSVGGSNLTADLVVTAPTNFEVRENGIGSYASSVSFTPASGTVDSKTIEVRIAGSASAGSVSGNVVCSSTGASSKNVAVSGEVASAAPTITVTEVFVPDMTANVGEEDAETINISGANLTANIIVTIDGANANMFSVTTSPDPLTSAGGTAVIKYTPTAQGTHSATLHVNSTGAPEVTRTLNGTATLASLVATDATAISSVGFNANWNQLPGAVAYELSVDKIVSGTGVNIVLSENFDGFVAGTTSVPDGADISTILDTYTQIAGWTGLKVYQAAGKAKVGTSSILGYIVTPTINLSANSGNFNLSFKSMAWSTDATELKIYLNDVLVNTLTGLNNDASYTLGDFSVNLTGGTASSKIKFEGNVAVKGRFFLEDLVITNGTGQSITPIAGSPFTINNGSTTTFALTGLTSGSNYSYKVRANDGTTFTPFSNTINVTTSPSTGLKDLHTGKTYTSNGNIIIQNETEGRLEIFNAVGQKLLDKSIQTGLNTINVKAKGVLFVKLGNEITKVIL